MRLFVALDLPSPVRQRLSWLAGGLAGARWVRPDNYHITLRFIGECPGYRCEEVDHALAALRAPGFTLTLSGVGVFDRNGRPASVWAGVDRTRPLEHLQTKIETALQRIGLEPERKRFMPHLTLARLDNAPAHKLAEWVQGHNLLRTNPVPVGHFTLFSSRLGKEQAAYQPEVEYDLLEP